jgi:hypothetical protein
MNAKKINEITRTHPEERESLMRWFQKMEDTQRISVMRQQTEIMRAMRTKLEQYEVAERAYCSLLIALLQQKQKLTSSKRKETLDKDLRAEVSRFYIDSITGAPRRQKEGGIAKLVRTKWFVEIEQLREQEVSWRKISDYIAKRHKKRVSHTHLAKLFEALKRRCD